MLLSALYVYGLEVSWELLRELHTEYWFVWLVRDVHMLGANTCVLTAWCHLTKAGTTRVVSIPRVATVVAGSAIFLLTLGACFTGYVLVCGQMSYWALTVILNLITVVPYIGPMIVHTLLSGAATTDVSIRRVFTAHWVIATLIIALVIIHLILVHRSRPSSLCGQTDRTTQLFDVLIKDILILCPLCCLPLLVGMRVLVHPDNWVNNDKVRTPAHIEPEPYFLWLFCMLKSRPSKVVGVISLWLTAIVCSSSILTVSHSEIKSLA